MITAPIPNDEADRLAALISFRLLDTEPEAVFDNVTRLAAGIAGVPIALISLVDADRQWFKARHGLDASETSRDVAFCAHTILEDAPMIVEDATIDPRFCNNPLVSEGEKIRFYAGFPLFAPNGHALGTLCVIDREPRRISPHQTAVLSALAAQVEAVMQLRRSDQQQRSSTATNSQLLEQLDREFQTTLSGIESAHHFMAKSTLDTEQQNYLDFASQALSHLTYLVDHIQTLEMQTGVKAHNGAGSPRSGR